MSVISFLTQHQLDIMMVLSGICGAMAVFACVTKTLSEKRKLSIILLELGAMLLLIADRKAYTFRGDVSTLGYWMVRISNFMVFSMTLFVIYAFNMYLIDLFSNEGNLKTIPRRLSGAKVGLICGESLIVISQFTGLYYTFDEMNRYQRSPGFVICYLFPLTILLLQLSVIVQYQKKLNKGIKISLLLFTITPLLASILQIFTYGVSLTNITMVGLAIVLFVFDLLDMNAAVDRAHRLEVDYLQEESQIMQLMFEQTTQALANAIDAKDAYTRGHSMRVAQYSKRIAELSGKSKRECEDIYYAALLHDVGKIGVAGHILNKDKRLTDEEYDEIKHHPIMGAHILSGITTSPYLSQGAYYHHERYDGAGYPEGLKGENIPECARIIAVADTYDAMTSKRSYRGPMPQQEVRRELEKGAGTQFDPKFAQIMIDMIDHDTEYQMKEQGERGE